MTKGSGHDIKREYIRCICPEQECDPKITRESGKGHPWEVTWHMCREAQAIKRMGELRSAPIRSDEEHQGT